MATTNKVTTLPSRNNTRVAPAPTPVPDSGTFGGSSHNIAYQIEGEGGERTLVLLINISDQALHASRRSAVKVNSTGTQTGGNPVISTSGGFQYLQGLFEDKQVGISVNIIAKDVR